MKRFYEYRCQFCRCAFSKLLDPDERDEPVQCTVCHSYECKRTISKPSVRFLGTGWTGARSKSR
jgi:putative FmdB family regulatory protein